MRSFNSSKRNKFLPEQFATYHFRRKYVSRSYPSFDHTECNSDDNCEDNTNTSLMADTTMFKSSTSKQTKIKKLEKIVSQDTLLFIEHGLKFAIESENRC